MKFVMTQSVCEKALSFLEEHAECYIADDGDPNNYPDQMQDADAIIVRIGKLDAQAIVNAPNLKVIGRTGVGYDSVDVDAATKAGIPIVITPGANNRSVAEHTVAMLLALSKNLLEGHVETEKGNFSAVRSLGKSFEILGKTIGFVGLGAIGAETARLCRALGMQTIAYDPFLGKERVENLGCDYCDNLENLFPNVDVLSLHLPLTAQTKDLIALPELQQMKPTAILLNCARGGIVNEPDLKQALEEGVIAAAGLDVFEIEPPDVSAPLFSAPNLLLSPHSAAQTREAVVNMHMMCVEGCLAVLKGEKWPHVANPEVYQHPRFQ